MDSPYRTGQSNGNKGTLIVHSQQRVNKCMHAFRYIKLSIYEFFSSRITTNTELIIVYFFCGVFFFFAAARAADS